MKKGHGYKEIKKVYSISVLYFDLGEGEDYAYHGKFKFQGMTQPQSELRFTGNERKEVFPDNKSHAISPDEVFPEFFLLRVNQFNEVAKTPIEEWMEYLKDGSIKDNTQTPGLQEAREKLNYMMMTPDEQHAYEDYIISVYAARDVILTAKTEGRAEGRAEGLVEGRAEGQLEANLENARRMIRKGFALEDIMEITGLTESQIRQIKELG